MGKFESGLDHAGFLAVKEALTTALASAIEAQLREMGENVRGISWFSSCAVSYMQSTNKQAA